MIVYLSGGMKTGNNWQDVVMEQCYENYCYLDPRSHNLSEPIKYTNWDLKAIENSDIVFAYMDKDNPSGYGLSLEVGYAKGLDKIIIMVDEQNKPNMAIVRCCANYLFDNLEDGIKKLREFN